jgi:hypothetical protein
MLKTHSTFELESYSIVKDHEVFKTLRFNLAYTERENSYEFLVLPLFPSNFLSGALCCLHSRKLVELLGFEPRTSALQRPRSPN